MNTYSHYGVSVVTQYCNNFRKELESNKIKYIELPFINVDVLTYLNNGAKKYAVIKEGEEYDTVYITTAIPDDCNWDKLVIDILNQSDGEKPMTMKSRLKMVLEQVEKTVNLSLSKKYPGDGFKTLFNPIPGDELIEGMKIMLASYGYDAERIRNSAKNDQSLDKEFIELLIS